MVTEDKYSESIGQELDISKGVYALIENGIAIAQDDNSLKLASMIPNCTKDSND